MLEVIIVPDCWAHLVSDVDVSSLCVTDHSLVLCQLDVKRERPTPVTYHYRCIKQIDLDEFRRRVQQSQLYRETCASTHNPSVDDYVKLFDDDITRILDNCAPLRSTTRRSGSHDCRCCGQRLAPPSERVVTPNVAIAGQALTRTEPSSTRHAGSPVNESTSRESTTSRVKSRLLKVTQDDCGEQPSSCCTRRRRAV